MTCSSSPFIFPLQMHGWKTVPACTLLQGRRSHFHSTSCRNSDSSVTEITGVGSSTSTTLVCSTKVWGAVLIYASHGSALVIIPGKPSEKKICPGFSQEGKTKWDSGRAARQKNVTFFFFLQCCYVHCKLQIKKNKIKFVVLVLPPVLPTSRGQIPADSVTPFP